MNNNDENIHKKGENEIFPAYYKKDYLDEEKSINLKSNTLTIKMNDSHIRKSAINNTMASSNNFNSNNTSTNNYHNMINFIPCINCGSMINIDDIGDNFINI